MPRSLPPALLALTLGAFAIGTTEFVIAGLVPAIAAGLGVSLPSAGLLVSLYALGGWLDRRDTRCADAAATAPLAY